MIGPGRKEFSVNVQSQTGAIFQYFLQTHVKEDITLAGLTSFTFSIMGYFTSGE